MRDARTDYLIRPGHADDVPGMVELLAELFAIEADFSVDPTTQQSGLALLLADPDRCSVIVAEAGGKVVGMVTVQVLISTAEGGPVGLLEDLVVGSGWRGRGVGTALLSAAESWARGRGLRRLQLLADRDNDAGLGFYSVRGWQQTRLVGLRRDRSALFPPRDPSKHR